MKKANTISVDHINNGLNVDIYLAVHESKKSKKILVYNPMSELYTILKNGKKFASVTDKYSAVEEYNKIHI